MQKVRGSDSPLLPNDKRYDIYYGTGAGTPTASNYFKAFATKEKTFKYIELDKGEAKKREQKTLLQSFKIN